MENLKQRDLSKYDYEKALDFLGSKMQTSFVYGFNNLCQVEPDNYNFEKEKDIYESFNANPEFVKQQKKIMKKQR